MAFPVPEEFLHYAEGFQNRIVYWHVVRLIGWGQEDDGSHYWIASYGRLLYICAKASTLLPHS
ncbi:unnamed protein product [Cylicostephanus goldi]|uniref:Uncharacterized protein n=1 Tax=Cylicostephanus goldi TaxID=71465 RepID=A0A3P6QXK7_CYLGO|nr:unnamed protein product [Cylicostephanus goldi]